MENQNSSLNLDKNPLPGSAAQPFGAGGSNSSIDTRSFGEGEIYKPSGKVEASGLPLMILGAVLSGIGVGLVYHFVSQFIDLIILFPIIAGACIGGLIGMGVKTGKVRSPRLAGTVGVLGGILLWSVMQIAGAYSVRDEMIKGLTRGNMPVTPATMVGKDGKKHQLTGAELAGMEQELRGEVESYLSPTRTLMLYEQVRGEAGSSIEGLNIQGGWFWGLEAFEALLLIGTAGAVASGAASRPFCENCDTWHEHQDILRVHPVQNPILWDKIAAKDWVGLMDTPVGQMTDSKNLTTVSLSRCPKCDCGTLSATSSDGTVPAEIQHLHLAPESSRTLVSAAAAPAAGAGSA